MNQISHSPLYHFALKTDGFLNDDLASKVLCDYQPSQTHLMTMDLASKDQLQSSPPP